MRSAHGDMGRLPRFGAQTPAMPAGTPVVSSRVWSRAATLSLAIAALPSTACFLFGKESDTAAGGKSSVEKTTAGSGEANGPGQGAEVLKIARATVVLADVKAKGEVALYYERKGVRSLYALAGDISVPDWSASTSGEATLLRDDDWLTGVDCTPADTSTCAIGMTFEAPAQVRAFSLHGAMGPKWRDYTSRPRPKTLRIHFDGGYVDATISDGPAVRWVLLDAPVTTKSLAVEVLDTHGKSGGKPIRLNEIEVYGDSGPRREPLELDLARARFYYETERWKTEGDHHEIRPSYVETVNAEGIVKRVASATAFYGEPTDRVLLFETLRKTNCAAHESGSYLLLDRQTRLWLDVGRMGGLHRPVWRNASGLGFAIGNWRDDPNDIPSALLFEDESLTRKRIGKSGPKGGSIAAQMDLWGMSTAPVDGDRSGDLAHPPAGCTATTADTLTSLTTEFSALGDASTWMSCKLEGGGEILIHQATTCPGSWAYVVKTSSGAVIANKVGPTSGRAIRVTSQEDGSYWLELDQDAGNKGKLMVVSSNGDVADPLSGVGFSLRLPGVCDCNGVAEPDANAADGGDGTTGGVSPEGGTAGGESSGTEPDTNLDGGDLEPSLGDDDGRPEDGSGLPDVEDEP